VARKFSAELAVTTRPWYDSHVLDRKQIEAYVIGGELPADVVAEIEQQLGDPKSEVYRVSREFAKMARRLADLDGPFPGDPGGFPGPNGDVSREEARDLLTWHTARRDELVQNGGAHAKDENNDLGE
jgi:hypothetical protein